MSTSTTTPARARRRSRLWWAAAAAGLVAVAAAVTLAVWPASAADKARDDGRQLGEAVGRLYDADTTAEVDAALNDIDVAIADTRDHAGDAVARQAADQRDALERAADGFAGSRTADSDWDVALYQDELDGALDDLAGNASDFRAQGPEVRRAFWEGVQDGLDA